MLAGLAGFSCRSCHLDIDCRPAEQSAAPITALPTCSKLSLSHSDAVQLTWAALSSSGGVRNLGKGPIDVLDYTGSMPPEPWALVVHDIDLVTGVPRDRFAAEASRIPGKSRYVWRNAAGLAV